MSDLCSFLLYDLDDYFAGVLISASENHEKFITNSPDVGFKFSEITLNNVILVIAHFSSQITGEDDISQRIIVKSLPTIG